MGDYKILLDLVTKNVQKRITEMGDTKVKGTDFEKIVYEELLKVGVSEDAITHSTQKFPDFVIDDDNEKIGVEVKKQMLTNGMCQEEAFMKVSEII